VHSTLITQKLAVTSGTLLSNSWRAARPGPGKGIVIPRRYRPSPEPHLK
jgi:hypothetical protein